MTSNAESSPTSKRSRRSATVCAAWLILVASSALTSCNSVSSAPRVLPSLYQPPVLRLPAGQPVPTVDGVYTPATDEVWHSDARFRRAEQQASDAAAALAQERNRPR